MSHVKLVLSTLCLDNSETLYSLRHQYDHHVDTLTRLEEDNVVRTLAPFPKLSTFLREPKTGVRTLDRLRDLIRERRLAIRCQQRLLQQLDGIDSYAETMRRNVEHVRRVDGRTVTAALRSLSKIEELYGPLKTERSVPTLLRNFQPGPNARWLDHPFYFNIKWTHKQQDRPPRHYYRTLGPFYLQIIPQLTVLWKTKDLYQVALVDSERFAHPHVSSGGIPCLGDAASALRTYWQGGEWLAWLQCVLELLSTYNDHSPYCPLTRFWAKSTRSSRVCTQHHSRCSRVLCVACGELVCVTGCFQITQTGEYLCPTCQGAAHVDSRS